MRIKNVKNKVTETLKRHKTARDNDMQLLAIIWNQEVGGKDKAEKMTAFDLLCLLARKELSNPVSLWRCRQMVQQNDESLRGEKWKARQEHSKDVVEEIKSWDAPVDKDDIPENQGELF